MRHKVFLFVPPMSQNVLCNRVDYSTDSIKLDDKNRLWQQ